MSSPVMPYVWTLDGQNFGDGSGPLVTSWEGWDGTTETRIDRRDRVGSDGVYLGGTYYGPRSISLAGVWVCSSTAAADDARDVLCALFRSRGRWGTYEVSRAARSRSRSAFVVVDDKIRVDVIGAGNMLSWSTTLLAADPRLYDTGVTTTAPVSRETGATGGVMWNGIPGTADGAADGVRWNGIPGSAAGTDDGVRWQSGVSNSGVLSVTNTGRAPAPVTIHVTAGAGGLTHPAVTRLGTGQKIQFNGSLLPGEVWTVDTGTGVSAVNGQRRNGSLLVSSLFDLEPGSNLLHFTSEGPTDEGTLHTVHRNAHLNG